MSLIKCDDCGSDISDSSLFCPHCGRPTHLNKAYPRPGEVPEAYTKLAEASGVRKMYLMLLMYLMRRMWTRTAPNAHAAATSG